jgi:hypothetical protein
MLTPLIVSKWDAPVTRHRIAPNDSFWYAEGPEMTLSAVVSFWKVIANPLDYGGLEHSCAFGTVCALTYSAARGAALESLAHHFGEA